MVAETEHVAVPPEIGFGIGIADSAHVAVLPDNAVVYVKLTSICNTTPFVKNGFMVVNQMPNSLESQFVAHQLL